MKQALWTLGNDFSIQDELGDDVFLVKGKVLTLGDKLAFCDIQGRELAFISQKLLSFKRTYEIQRDGKLFARVIREFSFFKDAFTVDIPGPNDYSVTGDFWDHEYRFTRLGRDVAYVSKEYFTWADTYGIDIADGEDDVTILATAVVIDLVNQAERKR
jgi:uncharacterized protein YxjI